jgi:hypothetical protein
MKKILPILILLLFSCGTRTAVKSTEITKESAKVEQTTNGETTAKIERKEVETETKEVGKINFAITPNPTFQKLSKDCPQNIIYKDKTGTEVSIPYENQLINLDSQNSLESKLKASEEYIESLTKENNNLKSEIHSHDFQLLLLPSQMLLHILINLLRLRNRILVVFSYLCFM